MIIEYRQAFNRNYTEEKYRQALRRIEEKAGGTIPFRIAESPIFIPSELLGEMIQAAAEIMQQLTGQRAYHAAAQRIIPDHCLFPNEDRHPLFMLFDYALAYGSDGAIKPMLIELQGFPSLFAFQYYLSQAFQESYGLAPELQFLGGGLNEEAFRRLFCQALLNDHAPENAALVDVRPWEQGTWPDFALTQRLCPGLAVVGVTELKKKGRRLYYTKEGREIPLQRIYYRIVWEELKAHEKEMSFRLQEEFDGEWAGHPNWFFKYSKLSLPFLQHPNVPRAYFLDQLPEWPDHLENYILKPLFSFSGRGLVLNPCADTLDRIPAADRKNFILQEKVRYAEAVAAPQGTVRCEMRLMYIWLDEMVCAMTLPRMSRGDLMGCAYNKTDPGTGHGIAFFERGMRNDE